MLQNSIDKNRLDFVRLRSTKAVEHFDCGDRDLNDFILNHAAAFQKYLIAVTYACVDVDDASKVYAYCSLANDKVSITDFKDKTEFNRFRKKRGFPNEKRLKSYPAVPFYEKNGFRFMNAEDNDPHTRLMYYDLMDIVA